MGRSESKRYMYLQTIHHRPIVEGASARMPEDAYDYIDANPLLRAWRKENRERLTCNYDIGQALSDLYADGFRYIVVHDNKVPNWLVDYFITVEPIHQDKSITVFALADLQANPPCKSPTGEG
jgi:hypothetical protein